MWTRNIPKRQYAASSMLVVSLEAAQDSLSATLQISGSSPSRTWILIPVIIESTSRRLDLVLADLDLIYSVELDYPWSYKLLKGPSSSKLLVISEISR